MFDVEVNKSRRWTKIWGNEGNVSGKGYVAKVEHCDACQISSTIFSRTSWSAMVGRKGGHRRRHGDGDSPHDSGFLRGGFHVFLWFLERFTGKRAG